MRSCVAMSPLSRQHHQVGHSTCGPRTSSGKTYPRSSLRSRTRRLEELFASAVAHTPASTPAAALSVPKIAVLQQRDWVLLVPEYCRASACEVTAVVDEEVPTCRCEFLSCLAPSTEGSATKQQIGLQEFAAHA